MHFAGEFVDFLAFGIGVGLDIVVGGGWHIAVDGVVADSGDHHGLTADGEVYIFLDVTEVAAIDDDTVLVAAGAGGEARDIHRL